MRCISLATLVSQWPTQSWVMQRQTRTTPLFLARDPIDGEAFMAMPEHLRGGWASEGEAAKRIYRTGDLVRWLPDGSLQVWVGWSRCLQPSRIFFSQATGALLPAPQHPCTQKPASEAASYCCLLALPQLLLTHGCRPPADHPLPPPTAL